MKRLQNWKLQLGLNGWGKGYDISEEPFLKLKLFPPYKADSDSVLSIFSFVKTRYKNQVQGTFWIDSGQFGEKNKQT